MPIQAGGQFPGLQYYQGPSGQQGPFQKLQELMLMKMKYDQEKKMRSQQIKDRMNQMKEEYEQRKRLAEFEAGLEKQMKSQQMEKQMQQTLAGVEELQEGFFGGRRVETGQPDPRGDMGLMMMPIARAAAAAGQELPLTQMMQTERKFIPQAKQETPLDIAKTQLKEAETQEIRKKLETFLGMSPKRRQRAAYPGAFKQEETERKAQEKQEKQEHKALEKKQKAGDKELDVIMKRAGADVISGDVEDEEIIEAIEYLATKDLQRHNYRKYLAAIEEVEEPGLLGTKKVKRLNRVKLTAIAEGRDQTGETPWWSMDGSSMGANLKQKVIDKFKLQSNDPLGIR